MPQSKPEQKGHFAVSNFPNPGNRGKILTMAHLKSRSDSFIARLDQSFETWLENHLPLTHRLIRSATDRVAQSYRENPKAAQITWWVLMAVAVIGLVVSMWLTF